MRQVSVQKTGSAVSDSAAVSSSAPGDAEKGTPHYHVAIIGTGFAGLGMAIRMRQQGMTDFVILERADDAGGTWRDNTYPGCACDVQSNLYSFSFALNANWSRAFSPQGEIWDYLRACIKKYGVAPHIRWNSELREAYWDEEAQGWRLTTAQGMVTADILVLGQGPLSEPSIPPIPGLADFKGTIFHSATWNHDHDLHGERVAVIGTGASSIQFVPHIQPQVAQLVLYQRTPAWIVPRNDRAVARWKRALFRTLPVTQQMARSAIYWQRELGALFMVYRPKMMSLMKNLAIKHLDAQVKDPELRAKLTPNYTIGCKRILLSDDFYPAITQPNVSLVTDKIREVRAHSIVSEDGEERPSDTIIFATGFHVTDMPMAGNIHGRGGHSLAEVWQDGMQAYLGTTVVNFPNLFMLLGPNTGLGHTSVIHMIESQIAYVVDGLKKMDRQHLSVVEVQPEKQAAYNEEVQRKMQGTVWSSGCKSWYLDAHGRNPTIWPGFTFEFRRRTRQFDEQNYQVVARPQPVPTH